METIEVVERNACRYSTWETELGRLRTTDRDRDQADEFCVMYVAKTARQSLLTDLRFGSGQDLSESIADDAEKLDLLPPEFLYSLCDDLNGSYGTRYVQNEAAEPKAYSK
jgi:hypothetical protein